METAVFDYDIIEYRMFDPGILSCTESVQIDLCSSDKSWDFGRPEIRHRIFCRYRFRQLARCWKSTLKGSLLGLSETLENSLLMSFTGDFCRIDAKKPRYRPRWQKWHYFSSYFRSLLFRLISETTPRGQHVTRASHGSRNMKPSAPSV